MCVCTLDYFKYDKAFMGFSYSFNFFPEIISVAVKCSCAKS